MRYAAAATPRGQRNDLVNGLCATGADSGRAGIEGSPDHARKAVPRDPSPQIPDESPASLGSNDQEELLDDRRIARPIPSRKPFLNPFRRTKSRWVSLRESFGHGKKGLRQGAFRP